MFRKKKEYVRSRWLEGLHDAEEFMKIGWYYDDSQSTYNQIYFKHAQGGSMGWLGLDGEYNRGLLAYVEHRKLNGEIYENR